MHTQLWGNKQIKMPTISFLEKSRLVPKKGGNKGDLAESWNKGDISKERRFGHTALFSDWKISTLIL